MRNRSASVLDSARCTKCARGWLRSRPGASWDPPGEAFGRSPNALGPPRTPEDRSQGLSWASRTRPKRVPARSRNGFERQKPPKINFASIFRRFGLRFRRYSKDFSSNFFELPATKAQNRNLKKESRDPHFASWFWRGAVASYCLHVFRNDFRTLHAQPYLGACPQAHLVLNVFKIASIFIFFLHFSMFSSFASFFPERPLGQGSPLLIPLRGLGIRV